MRDYKETKRGFRIVPRRDFDLKHVKGDIARSTCPDCSEDRGHPGDPSVRINLKTGLGKCFHCGRKYILEEKVRTYHERTRPKKKHDYLRPQCDDLLVLHTEQIIRYLAGRGLDDEELLRRMHVMEARRSFKGVEFPCIAFPSYDGDVIVNCMYRTTDKRLLQERDCELIPWNIDAALGQTELFITEGRMDALSLAHSGYDNVVSVANGSHSEMQMFDRFRYSHLDPLQTIYIAGDDDTEGMKLREALSQYFGESRCRIVRWEWPEGDGFRDAKDANECLMKGGKEAVRYCVEHAHDCPIRGEISLSSVEERVDDIRANGLPEGKTVGLYDLDENLKFLLGQFIVLTGSPGTGKSTFADFLAVRLLTRYGWKCAMYSPEKRPVQNHYAELEAKLLGYNIHDRTNILDSTHQRCKEYMQKNIFHIGGDIRNDLDTILHVAKEMQTKYGIRLLLIDPFAYIDLSHESGVTDYEKINENIKSLAKFASDNEICTILVAHPRKPVLLSSGKMAMPSLYDISGSSMFYNLCDTGVVLHKDEVIDRVVVYVEKVRDQPRMGRIGHGAICFDAESGRYNISHEEKVPGGVSRYIDYTINHKIWIPDIDGLDQELDFSSENPFSDDNPLSDELPF